MTTKLIVSPPEVVALGNIPVGSTRTNPLGERDTSTEINSMPEIVFITSFPPRECGIASYSQDLLTALSNQFGQSFESSICALESNLEQHTYNKKPKYILNTDQPNSYLKIAFLINKDVNIKLIVIQHEFGFFATNPDLFRHFISSVNKPISFAFHTVLPEPSEQIRMTVLEMTTLASSIIVMTNHASAILSDVYNVPSSKISVIPHGTHLVPAIDREKAKKTYCLSGKKVLSTFGLLGRTKSIETTLDALPSIIERFPEVVFLVLGKTHPTIKKRDGEQYREMLEEKVRVLHLTEHVRFVNEYLPLPTLLEYLQLTDIYLFTSNDPNQAVSGTFSYAISSGCPVVSTPIPHAKEVISNDNGILVDFESPKQLAFAVLSLLENTNLRAEISSNSLHKMAITAWQNSAISHAILFQALCPKVFQLNFGQPAINLNHIRSMTTTFGMIQFSKLAMPDTGSGYTLDDNARALIALCQHYELYQRSEDLTLISTYLDFIKYCLQPSGNFLNYVTIEGKFSEQNYRENLEDSTGRAIWALGYVVSLRKVLPSNLSSLAEDLLEKALLQVYRIHSTRAMAFIIKGLYYQNSQENYGLMMLFGNRLLQMYKHEKDTGWHWFENYLTYGNSVLSEAMLCAYISTNSKEYRSVAVESFDFLLSKIFIDGKIKVISNKGWHVRDTISEPVIGGEQPIDVAYTIMALEHFYRVFDLEHYKQKATAAFNWFLGDNHLNQTIFNPSTGGCYDGLEEHNVNLNQGAESTLSYFMARLAIERMKK